jgi:hypothetical protein
VQTGARKAEVGARASFGAGAKTFLTVGAEAGARTNSFSFSNTGFIPLSANADSFIPHIQQWPNKSSNYFSFFVRIGIFWEYPNWSSNLNISANSKKNFENVFG